MEYYQKQGFTLVDDKRCVEEYVMDNNHGTVVSYNSSALFNLKCIYGDNIRCISLWSDLVSSYDRVDKGASKRLNQLFRTLGVEIIEI